MTLSVLLSLVGFLLTIGIVVMIHEGGHYLAAKWLGFGVKRFSIGMGRVLWRRRAWDTEFAVSLLPIGGGGARGEGGGRSAEEADELREQGREPTGVLFDSGPRWKKAIVVTAGPLMNFVLAVMLFTASGAIGVRDIAPYVEPAPASQAQTQGVGARDLVTAVDGRRIVGVMDFNSALLEHTGKADVPVTFSRAKTGESYVRHFDLSGLSLDEAAKTNGFVLQKLGFLLAGRGVTILKVEAGGTGAAPGLTPCHAHEKISTAAAPTCRDLQTLSERRPKKQFSFQSIVPGPQLRFRSCQSVSSTRRLSLRSAVQNCGSDRALSL